MSENIINMKYARFSDIIKKYEKSRENKINGTFLRLISPMK